MRADLIRIYKSVHTWTGILCGMALFIAFYAGALTVFKETITRWVSPPAAVAMVPLEQASQLITTSLLARPETAKDFVLHLRETEATPGRLSWKILPEGTDGHDQSSAEHYVATLNDTDASSVLDQSLPMTQVHIEQHHPSGLATFIDVLHRVVGLPFDNDPNRLFMGVISVLYTLALVSGLVILLPSLVKDLFALRIGKNIKRMWLDAHNVVGIFSLPFHLVMALTAGVFAFHDDIYDVQGKIQAALSQSNRTEVAKPSAALQPPSVPREPAMMLSPQELIARVNALSPGFVATHLQYQKVTGVRPMVRVWGRDETTLSPRAQGGFAALDPYSGRILTADFLPGNQGPWQMVISSFFALHMAAFGGVTVQWLYFILGIAGAWLFYSGNLLWVESRRRQLRRDEQGLPVQRRDTRVLAALTVGVCLGCVCGISISMVVGKWLHGLVDDLNAWHRYSYYAVFFASIAWAFLVGGARAGVHLLWFAAASTLMIPVTSFIALIYPSSTWWVHTSVASLGVDVTALCGSACFVWMALVTQKRVWQGTRDSVWSAHCVAGEKTGAPSLAQQ